MASAGAPPERVACILFAAVRNRMQSNRAASAEALIADVLEGIPADTALAHIQHCEAAAAMVRSLASRVMLRLAPAPTPTMTYTPNDGILYAGQLPPP